MNKTIKIIGLLLVVFMGVLVGCPTEAPKEKKKGDDGGGNPIANYTFISEYIDFHSYYAEVTNNTGKSFDKVVFVVSTKASPRDLTKDIDDSAKVIRKFDSDTLKTRKISISWQDTFKTDDLYEAAADNKGAYNIVGGKYVTATDTDMDGNIDGTHNKKAGTTGSILLKTDTDYTDNKVAWLLKANTSYFLHVYYNDGTDKTFTRPFTTASYPTSIANIKEKFGGENATVDAKGNDMKGVNFNAQPSPQEYRRSSFNPIIFTHANSDAGDTILYKFGIANKGGCFVGGLCSSGVGILIRFADKDLRRENPAGPAPTVSLQDLMLILPNVYETVSGTVAERKALAVARTRISVTNTFGGLTSSPKDIDIVNE